MDDDDAATPPATRTPMREDCWSEHATHTLLRAWGDIYLRLNRGHLRHEDWQSVAAAVNATTTNPRRRRSLIQCKNRIDTLKKKYKAEKSRVSDSDWPFFPLLDRLLAVKPSPPPLPPGQKTPTAPETAPEMPRWTVPVGPRSKRPAPSALTSAIVRTNFSAMAAAEAAAEAAEEEESSSGERGRREWFRGVAEAIERVGEVYGRVEEEKQRMMVEMEKRRMEFAKDLEVQRMRIFMDAQIQMERIRRGKGKRRSEESDSYL